MFVRGAFRLEGDTRTNDRRQHHYTIQHSITRHTRDAARTDNAGVLALAARLLLVEVVELGLAADRLAVVHVRLAHLLSRVFGGLEVWILEGDWEGKCQSILVCGRAVNQKPLWLVDGRMHGRCIDR